MVWGSGMSSSKTSCWYARMRSNFTKASSLPPFPAPCLWNPQKVADLTASSGKCRDHVNTSRTVHLNSLWLPFPLAPLAHTQKTREHSYVYSFAKFSFFFVFSTSQSDYSQSQIHRPFVLQEHETGSVVKQVSTLSWNFLFLNWSFTCYQVTKTQCLKIRCFYRLKQK